MDITQTFYDNLASEYDKLFQDWQATTREQAVILDKLFADKGYDRNARLWIVPAGSAPRPLVWHGWVIP